MKKANSVKKESKPKKEEVEWSERFPMTIEPELFEAWKSKRRVSDVAELMEITGKSQPIIYRALQFGHVKNDELCDTISAFYIARAKKQREQAQKIKSE